MANVYRDKYGILHAIETPVTEEVTAGPVEVDVACGGGYPKTAGGLHIVDYGNGDIFVGGNRNDGQAIAVVAEKDEVLAAEVAAILAKIGL